MLRGISTCVVRTGCDVARKFVKNVKCPNVKKNIEHSKFTEIKCMNISDMALKQTASVCV